MKPNGRLQAWIEPTHDHRVVASFIGVPDGEAAVIERKPAMQVCSSPDTAREWIEREAAAFGLPIEWLENTTHNPT